MNLFENIRVAMGAVKAQLLRTILTALIIAIGIMALVGILTAIDAIESSINSNFSSMGSNTFTIRNSGLGIRMGSGSPRPKRFKNITYLETRRFKETLNFPARVSVSTIASQMGVVKYGNEKTNPNTL